MDLSYGHSPFPFSDRPTLPHINKHLTNEKLKSRQFIQQEVEPQSQEAFEEDMAASYGYFTFKEIKSVYRFIKRCGIEDERRFGISLDELESAFRKVRRARQSKDEEDNARRLMNTFEFLLKLKRMTPKTWFKVVDTSQANKGDGKLTRLEFETGMKKTCQELGASMFQKHELQSMIKYMDPNGDGDLSYLEVQNGFAKIHQNSVSSDIIMKSGPIMLYLLDFMHEQQVRVRDLFNFMDLKSKKSVDLQALCEGIERIATFLQPSQALIEEYGQLKRDLGPVYPVKSLNEANSAHTPAPREKKQQRLAHSGKLPTVGASLGPACGILPVSPVRRTTKDYDKIAQKKFSLQNDWIDQFDIKLQNGLIMMSKM